MIPWIRPDDPPGTFPAVEDALHDPEGLLCVGGDLSVPRLVEAYRRGIFPWFSEGQPILWWSPDPRAVLLPGEFRLTRSLQKTCRNRGFEVTLDRAFGEVMRHCADADLRPEGTWITAQMLQSYEALHAAGRAHSVETWLDGRLVGGLYGVSLGRVFFGESMFSLERDASKVALKQLVDRCLEHGVELIDCQLPSAHLMCLGARNVPRSEFVDRLRRALPTLDAPAGLWQP